MLSVSNQGSNSALQLLAEDPEDKVVLQKQALDCKQKILDDFIFNLIIH